MPRGKSRPKIKKDHKVGGNRFIDLFAGLGGFHQALKALGHQCVFACEIDEDLANLYEKNFGLQPHGDIRSLDISSVPDHDILCAGFPCQPFSKAGGQQGLECPTWGDLFDYVIQILLCASATLLHHRECAELVRHRQGKTWRTIEHRLRLAGYSVSDKLLSPHHFGVPQIRERAFIVGRRGGLKSRFGQRRCRPPNSPSFRSWTGIQMRRGHYRRASSSICGLGRSFSICFRNTSSCPPFRSGRWSSVPPIHMPTNRRPVLALPPSARSREASAGLSVALRSRTFLQRCRPMHVILQ